MLYFIHFDFIHCLLISQKFINTFSLLLQLLCIRNQGRICFLHYLLDVKGGRASVENEIFLVGKCLQEDQRILKYRKIVKE